MPYIQTLRSVGLLVLRVSLGGLMMVHGIGKVQGFSQMAESFPDPLGMGHRVSLISAIGTEVGCSLLLIAGLATRFGAAALAFTMAVALLLVHRNDPWDAKELAAVYLCGYVTLILTGAGRFSLDYLIGKKRKGKADAA